MEGWRILLTEVAVVAFFPAFALSVIPVGMAKIYYDMSPLQPMLQTRFGGPLELGSL